MQTQLPHIFILITLLIVSTHSIVCNSTVPYQYNNACYPACPWNNTLITYLDNSTNQCVLNCSNTTAKTFADDYTKKCVSSCPSSPVQTYYDFNYSRCVLNCTDNPRTYAYTVNNTCLQYCLSPYWADQLRGVCVSVCPVNTYYQIDGSERTCVSICYPNYYAGIDRVCGAASSCSSSPVLYYGDDSTGLCVTQCPITKGTFADNSTRKCVFYCTLGSFADPLTQKCVTQCNLALNYFGSNITRNCLLYCNEGEFADATTRQCTLKCPSGTFGDYSTRKCVEKCPYNQSTFADSISKLCIAICPANYYADNSSRSCVTAVNCDNQTFGDPVTQKCVKSNQCPLGFYVDTSSSQCVVRCSTWGNPRNRFCESVCPWNPPIYSYYKDPSTKLCVLTCPVNPRTFGDNSTRQCVTTCPTGSIGSPLTMTCVLTCPNGFYANTETNVCVSDCTQNTTTLLYFFKPNISCIASCPIDYYIDNATMSCTMVCSNDTYAYKPHRVCLPNCPDGFFGDNYTIECIQACPKQNGQYADPSTNLCVDICPQNPDLYGQNINDDNLTCVTNCIISGFFADPLTRLCVDKCNTTAGYYGYMTDGRCHLRCPVGYGNPVTGQCVDQCPKYPKYFYGDNLTAICVLSCPAQSYGDMNNNMCVTAPNCTAGLFGDDASGLCVRVCSTLLNLYGDPAVKKCVKVCTFPYYADPSTRLCSLGCGAKLFKDNATKTCVKTCSSLLDLYNDPNSMSCQYNCTSNFFAVAYGNIRKCVQMCPSTPPFFADLQNKMCVDKCANETYKYINNSFRGCLDHCPLQQFNGTLSIDLFQDNTTWTCVQVCPYGYYAFKHPSNSSIRKCVKDCEKVGSDYYFAEDTTRICVKDCPMMFYGTYGDTITFKCSQVCSRNQYRDNSTGFCTYKCPNSTFANNVTWNCSGWCSPGYFAENINNTCVKYCPNNTFGYKKVCMTQCPNGTYFYNDNTSWLCVDLCPAYPAYYSDNNTLSCVLKCTTDYYADNQTRSCVQAINCTAPTVADPISGRCVMQCTKQSMYFLTQLTNLCGSKCFDGQFAYNQTNLCVDDCPFPYFGVNSSTDYYCTQFCPTGEFKWINGSTRMCITGCPTSEYRDELTMTCVTICPDNYYANNSNTKCVLNCTPLYADEWSKTCVDVCPNTTTASNTTFRCQQQCDYGQYSLNKVCYGSCAYPYYSDNLTRTCVTTCPNDPLTFANNITHSCDYSCSATQYAFLDNLTCASFCPDGYYKQLTLLLCVNPCPQNFYSDNETSTCVGSCATSTFKFADPTTQACVQICPSDPDLFGYLNQCKTQCPLGYFAQNSTRQCLDICPNKSATYQNNSWADDLTRRCLAKCSALSFAHTNNTHNVCLNICPPGFYASISSQSCVDKCPNGTFAYIISNTCVDACPSGLWADLAARQCKSNCLYNISLYSDDSTNTCVQRCPQYPDLFADITNQKCVLTCPPSHYAYNITRECLADCPAPYFANTYTLQCVLVCPIEPITFADNELRKCTPTCVNHTINSTIVQFYQDNSTLTCVRQCPQIPQKFYGQNLTNTCVQTCPPNTFGDNDTRVCLDKCVFAFPKFTWRDHINNFCVKTCPYGYYADNKTFSCQLICTNGTYADNSSRRCVIDCPINPASYSINLAGVGQCIYNCPNGTYSSQVTISCVPTCPTQPFVYYTYPPTNACVKQCIYPYFADKSLNACTQSCKVGYYGNLTTKVCQICQVQCVTCEGYLVCTSCIVGFFLYQKTCVITCPSYPVMYYAHNLYGVCYPECPTPYFGEITTQKCQLACPSISYPNPLTKICTRCPAGCITCNSLGCYTCLPDYTFLLSALSCNKNCNSTTIYYYNNTCYSTCPNGSYLSYDLVHCLSCSAPCATCMGSAGNCTTCIGTYYYLGKCLDACPNNFFVDNLRCVPCSSQPERCTLTPLSYTIHPFTASYRLQAYVIFNRAVNLTIAQFISTVQIYYNGQPVKSNQFTASVYNSTTFLVVFDSSMSLNQNSLSFTFAPGAISDQFGNVLTVVTISQNISITTGVNSQVSNINQQVSSGTSVISWILLIILGLFFIKSGYPALISIQMLQIMHIHIFLLVDPLPYLQYHFLDTLKYFNLMFLPNIFPSLLYTNKYYQLFTNDVSYLANSPMIVLFIIVLTMYLIVKLLSSKRLMSNKHVRRIFKRIRKYRMKYGIINDAFWVTYLYALFISMLQFKIGNFDSNLAILNMILAIASFFAMIAYTVFIIYVGYKYRQTPEDKIPKKYKFLKMQPSSFPLEIPIRYGRKLLLAVALLFTTLQSQCVAMLMINIVFFLFYLCFKPAKSPITNKVCLTIQLGYIVMQGLFIAYDKLQLKNISNQLGFSIGMIVVQAMMVIIILVWSVYRLILVIKQTDTWKHIYSRITRNTDPEYLKEQQRKRDLEFDFGELENRSGDQRTEHVTDKMSVKRLNIDEKFNIFDQDRDEEFRLQKPEISQKKKSVRPNSVNSSERLMMESFSSEGKGLPFGKKSAQTHRRNRHLQIKENQLNESVEQVILDKNKEQSKVKTNEKQIQAQAVETQKPKVLWDEIDFDQNEL